LETLLKYRVLETAPHGRLAGDARSPQYPTKAERRKYGPDAGGRDPAGRKGADLSVLDRIFGEDRARLRPLYDALVRLARDPSWYRAGGVPDTVTGRFHLVACVIALALLRFEAEEGGARRESALLTEIFIADMDSSLRQIGIGDFVVGKHVGRLVGALGGRLGAFRAALVGEEDLEAAVRRNVFPEGAQRPAGPAFVAARLRALHHRLAAIPLDRLIAGAVE
jgi:cytochrome b pre-mRNA-processing protein 3